MNRKREKCIVAVVDGQGGGIGRLIIEKLKKNLGDQIEIRALGTNAAATQNMIKAGAHVGATGEAAIVHNMPRVDIITGVIGITIKGAMLGEVTTSMTAAVGESDALKIFVPMNRCGVHITGTMNQSFQEHIDEVVEVIGEYLSK